MVWGSIFHFHQSPRFLPTPYGESRRFSMRPSTLRWRDVDRKSASVSQLSASTDGEMRSTPLDVSNS